MEENLSNKYIEVLQLENRRKIYDLVRKNPGCHFREIERKIKIPHGTLRYNLNFLARHNILIEKKDKNNIRYFTKNIDSEDSNLISLLRQNSIRKILLFFLMNKNPKHKDIVDFVKLSPSTVSWHLTNLARKNIIEKTKTGYNLIIDKNNILKLLITYKESFLDSLVNRTIEMWGVD